MTDIQVTLITEQNFGDHGEQVRKAFLVEPDETVDHLLHRIMRLGEFADKWRQHEPPTAWIELRYVDGTQPPIPPPDEAPF